MPSTDEQECASVAAGQTRPGIEVTCCMLVMWNRIGRALSTCAASTGDMVVATERLKEELENTQRKQQLVAAFLHNYQLTAEEVSSPTPEPNAPSPHPPSGNHACAVLSAPPLLISLCMPVSLLRGMCAMPAEQSWRLRVAVLWLFLPPGCRRWQPCGRMSWTRASSAPSRGCTRSTATAKCSCAPTTRQGHPPAAQPQPFPCPAFAPQALFIGTSLSPLPICSVCQASCRMLCDDAQRAGLELMDVMAVYQDAAYDRLCR